MKISVVIPVYNGEKTLTLLLNEIKDYFRNKKYSFEVIMVWDNGPDQSWNVIKDLKAANPEIIKALRLSRNFGQHNAIIAGFKYATGDFFITMDEDLQHNPYDIEIMLRKQMESDFDVVYGNYKIRRHNGFRNITSSLLKNFIRLGVPEIHPNYSPFRLIRSNIAKETLKMHNAYTFLDGYLSWITSSFGYCDVSHAPRFAGDSAYSIKKLFKHSINIFVTFSDLPLKIVTYVSFVFFAFSIIYSLITLYRKLYLYAIIPGYSSTIILLSLGFGMILFALGIIGEYVHRINQKTTNRPNFNIKEIL